MTRFVLEMLRDTYTVNAEDRKGALRIARMSGRSLARGFGRMPSLPVYYRAMSAWMMTAAVAVQVWAMMEAP